MKQRSEVAPLKRNLVFYLKDELSIFLHNCVLFPHIRHTHTHINQKKRHTQTVKVRIKLADLGRVAKGG